MARGYILTISGGADCYRLWLERKGAGWVIAKFSTLTAAARMMARLNEELNHAL
jgi:hypothetical protein